MLNGPGDDHQRDADSESPVVRTRPALLAKAPARCIAAEVAAHAKRGFKVMHDLLEPLDARASLALSLLLDSSIPALYPRHSSSLGADHLARAQASVPLTASAAVARPICSTGESLLPTYSGSEPPASPSLLAHFYLLCASQR